jgi:hypothetical protein
VDVNRYHPGGFSLLFSISGPYSESSETQFIEDVTQSFSNFDESWDKWISPRLLREHHNVVVFDRIVSQVHGEKEFAGELKLNAEFKFKWLHMECVPINKGCDKVENALYIWPLELEYERVPTSMTVGRLITSYTDLIALCDHVKRKLVYEKVWNQAVGDEGIEGVPSEHSYI